MNELTTLPQIEVEIKFYLGQTAQNIIEVGKRLIQAKSLVQHGQWQTWLNDNFQLSKMTANRFMNVAERFGKSNIDVTFTSTQMIALLSLPNTEETERFIEEKAAEGKAVADMTIKQLREEIAQYKNAIEQKDKDFQQTIAELEQELKDRPTVEPQDYQRTKDALIEAKVALERANDDANDKLDKARREIKKLKAANERLNRKDYEPPTQLQEDSFKLICADIRGGLPNIADNSVDFIITDPPYPKEFLPLYEDLSKLAARVLKDGGSLVCMTGQSYLPDVIELLATNLTYHWCLCYLTPGQKTQLWQRQLHTAWKPLLWFVKGAYKKDWLGDDVMTSPATDKQFHKWGQSFGGMKDIVERFTNPNDLILDPFLGGGTTGVVALKCKRKFIGVDIEQSCVDTTAARFKEAFNDE